MKTTNQSMCSTIYEPINFQNNYKLWQQLDLTVAVRQSYRGLSPEALFEMALRVNKKRQFLFVSKLIAKHLAVHPSIALGTGTLLASLLMENAGMRPHPNSGKIAEMIECATPDRRLTEEALAYKTELPGKTVFIGMAETATGLGHAVFQHFDKAHYLHTTREAIAGQTPSFVFEEEHSHATSHKVYAPEGMLEQADAIVLVDDEISTGNTLVNLVSALDDQFPGKTYQCLSILDWRNESQARKMEELAAERNIRVDVLSLMAGEFQLHHSASPEEVQQPCITGRTQLSLQQVDGSTEFPYFSETGQRYVTFTGRFGLASEEHDKIGKWAEHAAQAVPKGEADKTALVIGIGENMYLPLRFALALQKNTLVQTTTRSPIFASNSEGYPITEKAKFHLPDASGIEQFIYNLNGLEIERIYLIAESVIDKTAWHPLIAYLENKAPVEWISLTTA